MRPKDDARSSTLVDLLPAAVYTCEAPSGRITFFNAHATQLWGRKPRLGDTDERFCGSFKLWRPDGTPLLHDETPMAHALLQGTPARNEEVVIERPDGTRVTVVVNIDPIFDADGRITGAINVFHDATPVKSAEAARLHLAAIVDSSDDAIISKDLNGIITSWNQGAARIFGYTAEEAIGRPITLVIPEDRQNEEPDILARIRRGDRIDHFETIRRRKDGTLIDISLTISPILDNDGRVIGASKIARDITDRVQAAARIARAREEAEAANRAKDEFLAMLGHELRNPLAAVRNATMAARLEPTNRARALEIALRQTEQLGRIVDDLLDVARITRGQVRMRKVRVTLAELLQRTVDALQAVIEERGHTVTLELPEAPIALMADPSRLEQAVANLLTNAAKYSDAGGTITVIGERAGTDAVIRVRDRGIGIPADVLPRVFDLFAQGARPLDRTPGGLGIGLTLVRRIVELHGGTVEAHSEGPGAGAEFIVRLPALGETAVPARPAEPRTASRMPQTRQAARILMVEDNLDAAESLVMLLELLGHHVRVVHDGPSALEAARANVPDVMLIDIGLPGMSGYDLTRAIRADDRLKSVVLAALTGYGQPEDKTRAMQAGFDYHLVKPVDLDMLADLIGRLGTPA